MDHLQACSETTQEDLSLTVPEAPAPRFISLASDIPPLELEPSHEQAKRRPQAPDHGPKSPKLKLCVQAPSKAGCPRAASKNRRAYKGQSISLILGFMRRSRQMSSKESSRKYSSTRFEEKSFILR